MSNLHGVLTGDFVKSTSLTTKEMDGLRTHLKKAVGEINAANWAGDRSAIVQGEPDFFRGDAWQLLLARPEWSLRVAVYLRTTVLVNDADTRVSIGIGPANDIHPSQVSLSQGEAFTLSGRGLDEKMGARFRLAISAANANEPPAAWTDSVARLSDSVIGQWHGRQIEVARLITLRPEKTQAEIGDALVPSVTQQTVGKTLRGAGWYGLEDTLRCFESHPWIQP